MHQPFGTFSPFFLLLRHFTIAGGGHGRGSSIIIIVVGAIVAISIIERVRWNGRERGRRCWCLLSPLVVGIVIRRIDNDIVVIVHIDGGRTAVALVAVGSGGIGCRHCDADDILDRR